MPRKDDQGGETEHDTTSGKQENEREEEEAPPVPNALSHDVGPEEEIRSGFRRREREVKERPFWICSDLTLLELKNGII